MLTHLWAVVGPQMSTSPIQLPPGKSRREEAGCLVWAWPHIRERSANRLRRACYPAASGEKVKGCASSILLSALQPALTALSLTLLSSHRQISSIFSLERKTRLLAPCHEACHGERENAWHLSFPVGKGPSIKGSVAA